MISFSQLGKKGRLANQLFQVLSTMGIAEANNTAASFPEWEYEKYFNEKIPKGDKQITTFHEEHFHYLPVTADNVDLDGYFQSYKYFSENFNLTFKDEFVNELVSKSYELYDKETIGIHIRRGDYLTNGNYVNLPITYFITALISIPGWQDKSIVIVSDDIEYCKVNFECLPNAYFMKGSDIEDLAALSLCDHLILSNSSFSWMGAYFAGHNNVIHPGVMFKGEKFKDADISAFYKPEWKKHDPYQKIDLRDTTFTVPVFYDHQDRKKNLDLSLCILQQQFDSNYIIGEQGGNKFEYVHQWAKYTAFDYKDFHRTKMLNQMAELAETDIIVNWDCDVIIPPMQIYMAVDALRNGADMAYPYDGRFARMDRQQWFTKIEKSLDIGIVQNAKFSGKFGKPVPETSVGGAVLWRKESFIEYGMENEKMISFGPEDVERWERANTLRANVQRTGGCLYHMNHHCGPDSSNRNPHFKANHAELDKIREMNPDQLRQYVDTWEWRHQYTPAYYERISEGSKRSAKIVWQVLDSLGIKHDTVIDVGCGIGSWKPEGCRKYDGIDYGIPKKVQPEIYFDWNLEEINFEIEIRTSCKYDLALCLEVAEHISESKSADLIAYLCSRADTVLFSAAIPGQGGTGHINEQWQSWWAELFAKNGFCPHLIDIRSKIWNNERVEAWYKQNMVIYQKEQKNWDITGYDYNINLVHPEMFTSCIQYWKNMSEKVNPINYDLR